MRKKPVFTMILWICGGLLFAQPAPIQFRVSSYLVSGKQTSSQYARAELVVNDETQSWEITLYRKSGAAERIKLESFDDLGKNGVFRSIIIQETAGTSGGGLFAYMPAFEGNKIRVDLCDTKTERVRRRLIIEY
ncbi:MAG: hypothetical protein LBD31_06075 [Treponema sp.]|jgi:hypothetical protein|nr:hypothetical protein [Treponema sp.]